MGDTTNTDGDQSNDGAGGGTQDRQQNQSQSGEAGNDAGNGSKRDDGFEQLPAEHPLRRTYEKVLAENKLLKPKAKLVDDANEAKKTDAQKIADLQTKLDAQPTAVAGALREHLVELHGIDKDDAELFLTGDTPELLLKQVTRLLEQSGTGGSKRKNYVSKEGNNQRKPPENENGAFAKSLFNGSDE